MDPYGEKKLISPLHKKAAPPEEPVEQVKAVLPQQPAPPEMPVEEDKHLETLIDHLGELRKQLIKSAFVFIFFLIVVFSSINYWFPYVVKGHDLVILGPMEVIRFYTSISMTLALGLSLPFLCYFLWQFVKPGLKEAESKFIGLYSPVMLFLFSYWCRLRLFCGQSTKLQFFAWNGGSEFRCNDFGK